MYIDTLNYHRFYINYGTIEVHISEALLGKYLEIGTPLKLDLSILPILERRETKKQILCRRNRLVRAS